MNKEFTAAKIQIYDWFLWFSNNNNEHLKTINKPFGTLV